MLRLLAVLLLSLSLGGCATITGAAIGTAIVLGVAGGGAKFAADRGLSRGRSAVLINRKCSRLRSEVFRSRCENRLRYILHQYRE